MRTHLCPTILKTDSPNDLPLIVALFQRDYCCSNRQDCPEQELDRVPVLSISSCLPTVRSEGLSLPFILF